MRQVFKTIDSFRNYELQHGSKGDVRILLYGKVFRRFTTENKITDGRRYFENIKKALS